MRPCPGDLDVPSEALAPTCDVKFCLLRQRLNERTGLGELVIIARSSPITEDGLTTMMAFMDGFLETDSAKNGFSITWDMRALRRPSIDVIRRVAEWGKQPKRQEAWARLNKVCKVVVPSGFVFTLAKGILATFFFACPPVCDTYLITDPEQPEEEGAYFSPPPASKLRALKAQEVLKQTIQHDNKPKEEYALRKPLDAKETPELNGDEHPSSTDAAEDVCPKLDTKLGGSESGGAAGVPPTADWPASQLMNVEEDRFKDPHLDNHGTENSETNRGLRQRLSAMFKPCSKGRQTGAGTMSLPQATHWGTSFGSSRI